MDPEKKILLERIAESRDLLRNKDITITDASAALNEYKSMVSELISGQKGYERCSLAKSLLIVFNLNNFSELTVVIFTDKDGFRVIDYAGEESLLSSLAGLMNEDSRFYADTEIVEIKGRNYKIFNESMNMGDFNCLIITITESAYFRPSSFHILCDLILDIVKLIKYRPSQAYHDFFESISVDINSFLAKTLPGSPGAAYLFTFDQIIHFFKNTGFTLILELSADIESRLASLFSNKTGIFRISLSRFLVIPDEDCDNKKSFQMCLERKADFIFRGIVLPYTCSSIIFGRERSAYSILEKIIKSENKGLF